MVNGQPFKRCSNCITIWPTLDEFVSDKALEFNGYKADFEKLEYGLFFFTHRKENCFSTMAIEVKDFMGLYTGPVYSQRKTGGEECPGYCLERDNLDRCTAFCECAFVREIMQVIKKGVFKFPKQNLS